ncbi:MAG TPA: spondin domain-containing protein [Candidatus Binatia bacterium]|nr:spondin domain-containing protein [Candidatus Binatia bacterium]
MFTRILGIAVDAFLGVAGVALGIALGAFLGIAGLASGNGDKPTKFMIRVENTTKPDAFTASNGVKWSLAFSPGAAIVHTDKAPIFTSGKKDRGQGLEAQSEDGDPSMLAKSLNGGKEIKSVAVFNTPVGASAPGPITPGAAYELTVSAMPGDRLSMILMILMMGQSNDWFYAPDESGIELFKDGKAINGDITPQIILWNAGTEVDQEPGIGSDQGPRQKAPNTGKAENGVVQKIQDGKSYSQAPAVMRVTLKLAQ